jgi:phosphoglycerate dehydrogenase-like enzyme
MRRSDHLVLAAPATPETRHVVNARTLAHARPGLHLINVARGSLVDTAALLDALDQGRLARASLDVAEREPPEEKHRLYTHPRVRLSPHTSAVTSDFDARAARFFVDNCRRYLAAETLPNIVVP